MKNFGNSSRGYSQGVQKIFRAPKYRAHCVVIFAIAQLSHEVPHWLYILKFTRLRAVSRRQHGSCLLTLWCIAVVQLMLCRSCTRSCTIVWVAPFTARWYVTDRERLAKIVRHRLASDPEPESMCDAHVWCECSLRDIDHYSLHAYME